MLSIILIVSLVLSGISCAPGNPSSQVGDPNCKDVLDNCELFGNTSCSGQFEKWAETYCPAFCRKCIPIQTTPKPCRDELPNCHLYGQEVCSDTKYEAWAENNCRYYCKKCGAGFIYTTTTTTSTTTTTPSTTTASPENCYDKIKGCKSYSEDICNNSMYAAWAHDNCMYHCGFCVGTPTTPPPCINKLNNCKEFGITVCSDPKYKGWAEDNCRLHCQLCSDVIYPTLPSGKRHIHS